MDIADEEFKDEFITFGISLDDESLLDRLRELCQMYKMDASDIVMEWVAYSQTKKCQLSVENLDALDRERLNKKASKMAMTPSSSKSKSAKRVYDINSIQDVIDADVADDIIGAYATPERTASLKRQHTTPENISVKRVMGMSQSPAPAGTFSPASFSPAMATPSQKYSSRKNALESVCSFGAGGRKKWGRTREEACSVVPFDSESVLNQKFKYMFQKLSLKAAILNDQIKDMEVQLQTQHNIEEFSHLALPAQEQVTVVGRIGCDSNGKLNAKSVVLEGTRDMSACRNIPLDLSNVGSYSLFPGQIVALEGINNTGNKMVVKKIHEGVLPPAPEMKPLSDKKGLSIVVACGPFTTTDNTMFEPLSDLIRYMQRDPPDVCILCGPFLDYKHPEIEKGNLETTYEEFFSTTIAQLSSAITRNGTQLVVVPSQRDIHHQPVYPQPPFTNNKPMVHFVSDPSTINIEGIVLGLTSTDIMFHLGAEEISYSPGSADRLSRLAEHVITQQNYYPLYPPHEDVNIDYEYFEVHAKMPAMPHVMILPSDLRFFIKDVKGCCCINPGRLTKGQVGGTFARVYINPSEKPVIQNISAEVVRI